MPIEIPRKFKDIPEKVKTWAFCEMPGTKAFLVYKRTGKNVEAFCTCCGEHMEGIYDTESIEDQACLEIHAHHGAISRCPRCGVIGEYRARGKFKGVYGKHFWYIYGHRVKDDFVFRACVCSLTVWPNTKCRIEDSEYARIYLSKGKKAVKAYKRYGYDGEEYWTDVNPYYFSSGIIREHYHPDTFKEIEKCAMLKYGDPGRYEIIDYYTALSRYPEMELVQKLGMRDLEYCLLAQRGANINPKGKTIWDRLRINKDRLPDLKERHGDRYYLKAYQQERREGVRFENDRIDKEVFLAKMWSRTDADIMRRVFEHTTFERLKNYQEKQEALRRKSGRYFDVRRTYLDYIKMRLERGYDISNEIILFPKDLKRRHDEMVEEARKKEADERKKTLLARFPAISKKFEKLNKKFSWQKGAYLIRPAKDAAEIANEGRELHHCVGSSDTYFSKHSRGESFILFLRAVKAPDTPLATIEISGSRILQWYEAYDQKPDADVIQPWLNEYCNHLKKKNKKETTAAAG